MVARVSEPIGGSSAPESLVTVNEGAAFLGMQVRTAYLWAETGRIPLSKINDLRSLRQSFSSANGVPIGDSRRPASKAWTADWSGSRGLSRSGTTSSPITTARSTRD
jgi:hypothetical protein